MKKILKQKEFWVIILVTLILTGILYWTDNSSEPEKNAQGNVIIQRQKAGEGESTTRLEADIDGEKQEIDIEVSEQRYSQEQLDTLFEKIGDELGDMILGENEKLSHVTSDLNLITKIPDTGVNVSWSLDNYLVMNLQGGLIRENLTRDGSTVELTAQLSYEEQTFTRKYTAVVYQENLQKDVFEQLQDETDEVDLNTREEEYLALPTTLNGDTVNWHYVRSYRAFGILLLGLAADILYSASKKQKEKKEKEERRSLLELVYPQMISKFTLYLQAGMAMRHIFGRLTGEFLNAKGGKGAEYLAGELKQTTYELQAGVAETECYEHFGERCDTPVYRKFGTLIAQNLKKGSKGLTIVLQVEAERAFEERKNNAKRLGEEAGTKLLMPMFLMLLVVLAIIVIPAFLSLQL